MIFVHLWWWFQWMTGASNTSGVAYGEWSGFLSDLGEAAIIGGLVQIFRTHNCHVKGCWRIGKHPVGHYKVCKHHHPGTPRGDVTMEHIRLMYNQTKGAK